MVVRMVVNVCMVIDVVVFVEMVYMLISVSVVKLLMFSGDIVWLREGIVFVLVLVLSNCREVEGDDVGVSLLLMLVVGLGW